MRVVSLFLPDPRSCLLSEPTSGKGSPSRQKKPRSQKSNPPRPSNCFIFYRQCMWRKLAPVLPPNITNGFISKFIGVIWKVESTSIRRHFEKLAHHAGLEHGVQYPGYKYQPSQKKKQLTKDTTIT